MGLKALNAWAVGLLTGGGYLGLILLMAFENVIPIIPSELLMGLAGVQVAKGQMSMAGAILAGTFGSVAGTTVWWWLGTWLGYERFRGLIDRHGRWATLDWPTVERLNDLFRRRGSGLVLTMRCVPAMRSLISIPAGLFHMPFGRFLIATTIGSLVWDSGLVVAGYLLGRNVTRIDHYTGPVTVGIIGLVVLVYLYRVVTWQPERTSTG